MSSHYELCRVQWPLQCHASGSPSIDRSLMVSAIIDCQGISLTLVFTLSCLIYFFLFFIDPPKKHHGGVSNDPEPELLLLQNLSLTLINDFVATASSVGWNAPLLQSPASSVSWRWRNKLHFTVTQSLLPPRLIDN